MWIWPVTVCQVTPDASLACDCLLGDNRCESGLWLSAERQQMWVWPVTVCWETTDVSLAYDWLPGDNRCESGLWLSAGRQQMWFWPVTVFQVTSDASRASTVCWETIHASLAFDCLLGDTICVFSGLWLSAARHHMWLWLCDCLPGDTRCESGMWLSAG